MTISGYSGPACRETRLLLGVYVVGAIDPAERMTVDEHLGECPQCRDELASLPPTSSGSVSSRAGCPR